MNDLGGIKEILEKDIPPRVLRAFFLAGLSALGLAIYLVVPAVWRMYWGWDEHARAQAADIRAISDLQARISAYPSADSLSRCSERITILEEARRSDEREMERLWDAVDECRKKVGP